MNTTKRILFILSIMATVAVSCTKQYATAPTLKPQASSEERAQQYEQHRFHYKTGMAKSHTFTEGGEAPVYKFKGIRAVIETSEEARRELSAYSAKRSMENITKYTGVILALTCAGMGLGGAGVLPVSIIGGAAVAFIIPVIPLMVSANKDESQAVDAYNRHLQKQLNLSPTDTALELRQHTAQLDSEAFKLSYGWKF